METQLKKMYNTTIKIEVSVDSIAQRLLDALNPEFNNKAGLVDAVIGSALEKQTLGFIYNSLVGFTNDLAIQVGQKMMCTDKTRGYKNVASEGDEQPIWKNDWLEIGECTVIGVNPYSNNPVTIEFQYINDKGIPTRGETSVKMYDLKDIPSQVVGEIASSKTMQPS